ncbi:hypothetical protein L596_018044 [Steinernema carpocapsae]|uniref:Uncharacterized protein n=1 Tax=Steinernema carpocapsae TaxID=34508 RepID=A0A4U5N3W4_STECR|nr:hypothetical protein L596_018044 [Steinernema carpocapsae]
MWLGSGRLLLKAAVGPATRSLHKGVDSTPPFRFIPVWKRIGMYLFISATALSYPTYVLLNMDNLRPRPENALDDGVVEQMKERRQAREAQKKL